MSWTWLCGANTADFHHAETRGRTPLVLEGMQPRVVLFPHLCRRNDFATQVGKSNKLLLDRLQPFIPLSASDLSICSVSAITPNVLIQPLNIGDLFS
jgi:hypothetical protein